MTFLKEALSLAELVKGKVSPRPPVGAIIVNNSKIVGKGSTSTNPVKHAEIVALEEQEYDKEKSISIAMSELLNNDLEYRNVEDDKDEEGDK